jgi:hypothetical protein
MTVRNIEARIEKLETSRRRPDQILLVWRKPDSDVAAAVANAVYAAGDKMICAEWFGEMPPPAPKQYRDMWFEMDRIEYDYITRSLDWTVWRRRFGENRAMSLRLTRATTVIGTHQ